MHPGGQVPTGQALGVALAHSGPSRQSQPKFIGVIGSDAKAAILRRELVANGVPAERAAMFHCPVGLDFGTNHPHEIALSIAAQLLTERDRSVTSIG